MAETDDSGISERIRKDIVLFNQNISRSPKSDGEESKVVELARLYASDAQSYLEKGDLYTSFACISYAHGLLDAIRKLNGDNIGEEQALSGGQSKN